MFLFFFGGGGEICVIFFLKISNNELNVLKLEFEVNIMDNKTSHSRTWGEETSFVLDGLSISTSLQTSVII
jgi:hypothetical protein